MRAAFGCTLFLHNSHKSCVQEMAFLLYFVCVSVSVSLVVCVCVCVGDRQSSDVFLDYSLPYLTEAECLVELGMCLL